jgi:hypothetical protein
MTVFNIFPVFNIVVISSFSYTFIKPSQEKRKKNHCASKKKKSKLKEIAKQQRI